jgi:mevalonate kinase
MELKKLVKKFHSKILLFGEYSVIQNSMGLSIPFNQYEGTLAFADLKSATDFQKESNRNLRKFYVYLRRKQFLGELLADLDLLRLREDLKKGLYFDSNIPQGFGVGSSGALCAAIYDNYAIRKISRDTITKKQMPELKKIFSQMESYFHGTSSGMDPLICYLNMPVLIENKLSLNTIDLPKSSSEGKGAIFLIDTNQQGKTAPLVQLFLDKCKQNEFIDECRKNFIPYNDNSIRAFLKGETKNLFYNLYFLSKFLLEQLTPMVPDAFRSLWKTGLDTKAFYLKLCGSGGGGFLLGFTEDFEKAKQYLKDYKVQVIHRF